MLPNELVNDMYWHLNIVNELNALGVTKLSYRDVTRKILHVLSKDKHVIIFTFFEDLNKLGPTKVLTRSLLVTHELPMNFTKDPLLQVKLLAHKTKKRRKRKVKINKKLFHIKQECSRTCIKFKLKLK
jgi:hypothetical protein